MNKNPYRVAFTAEEVKKYRIDPDSIRAGFRGISHWPPLTPEQQKELDLRIALTMWSGIMELELQENPLITNDELVEKYYKQGHDPDLIRQSICEAREKY